MSRPPVSAGLLATINPIANEGLAFARNALFARLLIEADFGKLMLLASVLRLAEMLTDVGIERLMVQAQDGGARNLQADLHGMSILRGLCAGFAILVLAYPLSWALPEGPGAASYMLLALPPVIRGFTHLDMRRAERHFNFAPTMSVEVLSVLGSICLLMVLSGWIWGFSLGLAVFAVHQLIFVGLSHAVAQRPYRVRFSEQAARRLWTFGRMLVVNAALLWVTFQADRVLLAKYFTWADLAAYAIAFQLAFLPTQIITRATNALLAPYLRLTQRNTHSAVFVRAFGGFVALGAVFAIVFGLLAEPVIALVYGQNYLMQPVIYWAFALAAGIRILRAPVSQFALFYHRGVDIAAANVVRGMALIPSIWLAMTGAPLVAIVAAACVGEIAALIVGLHKIHRTLRGVSPVLRGAYAEGGSL